LGQVKGIAIALGIVKVCQSCDSKLQLPRKQARFFNGWLMAGRDDPPQSETPIYLSPSKPVTKEEASAWASP